MSESILSLQGITKSFGGTPVLNGIDLEAAQGEFITLLGSSGCGKTTTLRIIAGLEDPDQGRVLLEGQDMTHTEPNKRDVNTVFQNYALFPHMSVEQNIGYALKIRKRPKAEIREEVKKMLELVQLEGYQRRKPAELSGGQKQRVAIARSLINRPKILLLDEPLGALDLQLRRQMQQELKRLQKKLGITFIYITHDQEEALNMSDRIAVMREGRFEQIGTPAQVYDSPKTAYVARFVGEANIVKGQAGALRGEQVEFAAPGGSAGFLRRGYSFAPGQEVTLAIRGEQAQAVKGAEGPGLAGVVKEKSFAGGCCASPWSWPAAGSLSAAATALTPSWPPGTPCGSCGSRTRHVPWTCPLGRGNDRGQGNIPTAEKAEAPGVPHGTAPHPVYGAVHCGAHGVHGGPQLYDAGGHLGRVPGVHPE